MKQKLFLIKNNTFYFYKGSNNSIDHDNIKYEKFEMKCHNNELKDIKNIKGII